VLFVGFRTHSGLRSNILASLLVLRARVSELTFEVMTLQSQFSPAHVEGRPLQRMIVSFQFGVVVQREVLGVDEDQLPPVRVVLLDEVPERHAAVDGPVDDDVPVPPPNAGLHLCLLLLGTQPLEVVVGLRVLQSMCPGIPQSPNLSLVQLSERRVPRQQLEQQLVAREVADILNAFQCPHAVDEGQRQIVIEPVGMTGKEDQDLLGG
jgi:hypothetical protein